MTRRISFGGLSIRIPGAYSRTDAEALTPSTLGAINRIGIIGHSEGGIAGAAVMRFTNPASAKEILVGGNLIDGMERMWGVSGASSGAYEILCCRAETDAVQSRRDYYPRTGPTAGDDWDNALKNLNGDNVIALRARNYGAFTNNIKFFRAL